MGNVIDEKSSVSIDVLAPSVYENFSTYTYNGNSGQLTYGTPDNYTASLNSMLKSSTAYLKTSNVFVNGVSKAFNTVSTFTLRWKMDLSTFSSPPWPPMYMLNSFLRRDTGTTMPVVGTEAVGIQFSSYAETATPFTVYHIAQLINRAGAGTSGPSMFFSQGLIEILVPVYVQLIRYVDTVDGFPKLKLQFFQDSAYTTPCASNMISNNQGTSILTLTNNTTAYDYNPFTYFVPIAGYGVTHASNPSISGILDHFEFK
jgi:hypothetical protein